MNNEISRIPELLFVLLTVFSVGGTLLLFWRDSEIKENAREYERKRERRISVIKKLIAEHDAISYRELVFATGESPVECQVFLDHFATELKAEIEYESHGAPYYQFNLLPEDEPQSD